MDVEQLFHAVVSHRTTKRSGVVADFCKKTTRIRVKWSEGHELSPFLHPSEFRVIVFD